VIRWSCGASPLGSRYVATEPPFLNVGRFLSEAAYRPGSWVFLDLLPRLEALGRGELAEPVRATSEILYLEAGPEGVELGDLDPDPTNPPCTVPLIDFLAVARAWQQHLQSVGECVPGGRRGRRQGFG
jgi:hypothetical protein